MPVSDSIQDYNSNRDSLLQAMEQLVVAYKVLNKKIEILHQYSNKDFLRVNPYLRLLQTSLQNIENKILFQESLYSKSQILKTAPSLQNADILLAKPVLKPVEETITIKLQNIVNNTLSNVLVIKKQLLNKDFLWQDSIVQIEAALLESQKYIGTLVSFFQHIRNTSPEQIALLLDDAQLNISLSHQYLKKCTEFKGQVINSLQYHDITSQRLEHIRLLHESLNLFLTASIEGISAESPYSNILPEITLLHVEQLKTLSTEYLIAFQKVDHALTQTEFYLGAINELYSNFPIELNLIAQLTDSINQASCEEIIFACSGPAWLQLCQFYSEVSKGMESLVSTASKELHNTTHTRDERGNTNDDSICNKLASMAKQATQGMDQLQKQGHPIHSFMKELHQQPLEVNELLAYIKELKSQLGQVKDFEMLTRDIVTDLQHSITAAHLVCAPDTPQGKMQALASLEASYTMYSERAALEHIVDELQGDDTHELSNNEMNSLDYKGSIELF